MSLEDVRDLCAFLETLPPDSTPAQAHSLPVPFNFRRSLGVWKLLFLGGKPFTPDATQDAMYNRGAYLVEGPGHCAECHSARNFLGAIKSSGRFAGGADPEGKGWIPNITPHKDALAKWSIEDCEFFLATGLTPQSYAVGSNMSDVIMNLSKLTPEDRRSMAIYLKALPPRPGKPQKP